MGPMNYSTPTLNDLPNYGAPFVSKLSIPKL